MSYALARETEVDTLLLENKQAPPRPKVEDGVDEGPPAVTGFAQADVTPLYLHFETRLGEQLE